MGMQVRMELLMWDISVFRLKTKTSAKYGLSAQPRLVDIIAAVPPQYRKVLVPKLKAKPIRTASGVSTYIILSIRHHPPWLSLINCVKLFSKTRILTVQKLSYRCVGCIASCQVAFSVMLCPQGYCFQSIWEKRKRRSGDFVSEQICLAF